MIRGTRRPWLAALIASTALTLALAATVARAALPQQSGTVDLLTQANVQLDGAAAADNAATSVSGAGDVNGDGIQDVIVGAPGARNNYRSGSGSAYVVFGQASRTRVDLATPGSYGFRIDGAAAGDKAGGSVAGAGDVNGDGLADVLVGAQFADNNGRADSGSAYVVFGKASTSAVDLNALGAQGFRIDGAAANDFMGRVAGTGDVNGDGRPDVIVGAAGAGNNSRAGSGSAYVVFGKASTSAVDLNALGAQGFRIDGAAANDQAGNTVAGAGDLNGDGRAEVIVGAQLAGNNGRANSGSAYVVFGKGSTSAVDLNALGAQGFRIDGAAASDFAATSVAGAGDVNGDGTPDVIVGAFNPGNNGRAQSGSAYVVFGKGSTSAVDLNALGAQGFRIDGAAATDQAGSAVADAGDVNGDGRPDVIVGAPNAGNNGRAASGSAYEVYGFGAASLSYSSAITATVGQPIAPLTPTVNRTGSASFSVSPPLPAGLALDPSTGVVSGTPTQPEATTTHTVTMSDLSGSTSTPLGVTVNGAGAGAGGAARDTTPPTISGFSIARKFAVASGPTAVSALTKRGATFTYTLSELATSRIVISRAVAGRRSGGKCRAPTKALRRAPRCTRLVQVGTLTRRGQPAGKNRVNFTGRIGPRALRPGTYQAAITATDNAGNRSRPRTTVFKIVRT